jgi:hypothetical protein
VPIPANGTTRYTFKKPEFLLLSCSVHSFMAAAGVLVLAEHRFYALTDSGGSFSLAGVPPGTYRLFVWHEVLQKADREGATVTVTRGQNSVANVIFK